MCDVPFTVKADLQLGERIAPYLVARDADVQIREGEVPTSIEADDSGIAYQLRRGKMLVTPPNGVRLLVEDGRRITYHRGEHGDDKEVAIFLLGSAWGALCYQRGLIPLHASAVEINGGLHAFTGNSGAGKSTLSAAISAGVPNFFTDDVLIFDPNAEDDAARCYAGQKDLKLWGDALKITRSETTGRIRSLGDMDKHFARAASQSAFSSGALRNLFVLAQSSNAEANKNAVLPISGAMALKQLLGSIYRPRYAKILLGRPALLQGIKKLNETVLVREFQRDFVKENFDDSVAFISSLLMSESKEP